MPTPETQEKLTLTVEETAELLGLCRTTTYSLIKRNLIPALRLGKRIIVPKVALEQLLAAVDFDTAPW